MSVCAGRFPGASTFAWPGSRVNPAPRFWATIPVSGSRMPEPNP